MDRTELLYKEQQDAVYKRTDKLFAWLLTGQWLAGILIALIISPRTWSGQYSSVHIHVWTAIFLGGLIIALPVYLALKRPGQTLTRHTIAVGQMLYSALLIHLTGGRIESHFHVFGSLAFLSFYRDWRVLISATIVVALDHLLRGFYFPLSVYGVTDVEPWRWVEHAFWVAFEDIFLIRTCLSTQKEMHMLAARQACVEDTNAHIEETVVRRTAELRQAKSKLSLQLAITEVITEADTIDQSLKKILSIIVTHLFSGQEKIWGAYWDFKSGDGKLSLRSAIAPADKSLEELSQASIKLALSANQGLPGIAWQKEEFQHIRCLDKDCPEPRYNILCQEGLTAALVIPVMNKGLVLGVVEFFSKEPPEQDDELLATLLEAVGKQIGHVVSYKSSESEKQLLADAVRRANDAIFTVSCQGRVSSWNNGAEKIFAYQERDIKGQASEILCTADSIQLNENCLAETVENQESVLRRKDGSLVNVSISIAPLYDDNGNHAGASIIVRDITERKLAEKRIGEFYSIVSHELRTPLTSIRGALGLIEGSIVEAGSDEAMDLIEVARGSTDRLIRLINDMLDLKKIESGKLELHRSQVEACDLIADTLNSLRGMSEEACVALVYQEPERKENQSLSVLADWDKAVQILTNLASNAIKFSEAGGEVKIEAVQTKNKTVRFAVVDNGPGIPVSDLHKLFDKFQQLDSSDNRQKGGTGLGLAISKALVEEHGGQIGVESILGQGSTFWFELPAYNNLDLSPGNISEEQQPIANEGYVLIVEDDEGLMQVLTTFVQNEGYQVKSAGSLAQARELADKQKPELVILDINLPDGSGLDLIADLKQIESNAATPIIVVSGEDKPSGIIGNATILDWLQKPLDIMRLSSAIRRATQLPGRVKVLVFDDETKNDCRETEKFLQNGIFRHEIHKGNDASCEALYLTKTQAPNLLVLDIGMPNLDGFEVVDVLSPEESKTTPLIIYTGRDLSPTERQILTAGIRTHLTQSLNTQQDLSLIVNDLLGGKNRKRKEIELKS